MDARPTPTEAQRTIELGDYLKVLRERAWVIILSVVVVTGIVAAWSFNMTPLYQATAQLLRQNSASMDALIMGGSFGYYGYDPEREVQTVAKLMKLEAVGATVKDELSSERSAGALTSMISVQPDSTTDLVNVTAVSEDPEEAAAVANAFSVQLIAYEEQAGQETLDQARRLIKAQYDAMTPEEQDSERGLLLMQRYRELGILDTMQSKGYEMVQAATAPGAPFAPQPIRNIIIAVLVGLALGFGLAFLLEYLDKRIKDEETMEEQFGLPVLASIPTVGKRWSRPGSKRSSVPIGFADTKTPFLESYRTLRSNLRYFEVDRRVRTLLISSALPQEGKTVTTVNLALSLAMSGLRVIVLEADLRRPMIHRYLRLGNEIGLSSVLAGTHTFPEAMQLVTVEDFSAPLTGQQQRDGVDGARLHKNLYVVTSGPLPPNPAELLSSSKMVDLIHNAAESAEYVLVDTPPLLLVADGLSLATHVDGVILASRMYHTTKDEAREVQTLLERVGAHGIGVVANGVKSTKAYYYRYGYYAQPERR